MSQWRSIKENIMDSHFEEYKKELDKLNLKTREDLENLVKPLIKKATKIIVKKSSQMPNDTQFKSHFGGQPYFENGEEFPKSRDSFRNKADLEFVFQIYNENSILPENIKLVQFYYDLNGEMSFNTSDGGWCVKIYENLHPENVKIIEKPRKHNTVNYCEIEYMSIQSLPDWDGLESYSKNASMLSCVLDENKPWRNYKEIAEKLVGEQEYRSQLGGYPQWVQGNESPKSKNYDLLFQIDSESDAGLMWGDCGLIYVFYNRENKTTEYLLQCF